MLAPLIKEMLSDAWKDNDTIDALKGVNWVWTVE